MRQVRATLPYGVVPPVVPEVGGGAGGRGEGGWKGEEEETEESFIDEMTRLLSVSAHHGRRSDRRDRRRVWKLPPWLLP